MKARICFSGIGQKKKMFPMHMQNVLVRLSEIICQMSICVVLLDDDWWVVNGKWWALHGNGKWGEQMDKIRSSPQKRNLNIYCDCNEKSNFIGFFSGYHSKMFERAKKKKRSKNIQILCPSIHPFSFSVLTSQLRNIAIKKKCSYGLFVGFDVKQRTSLLDLILDSRFLLWVLFFCNSFRHSSLFELFVRFEFELRIFFYIPTRWDGRECFHSICCPFLCYHLKI